MNVAPAPAVRRRTSVLVVDDDPLIRKLLAAVLADADIELREAIDGASALDAAVRDVPTAMIVDLMMPGLDGVALCRELRAHPRTAKVRIVMLTARADDGAREAALAAGADAFLTKPFSTLDLLESIRQERTT